MSTRSRLRLAATVRSRQSSGSSHESETVTSLTPRKSKSRVSISSAKDEAPAASPASSEKDDDEDEAVRKRRASKVLREAGGFLKRQMETFKSSIKAVLSTILYIVLLRGLLDMAWHVQFAHILAEHTERMDTYALLAGPGLWYVIVMLACGIIIYYVRSMSDDALLHMIRALLGLEVQEGEEDIFESFNDIKDRLQKSLEGYDKMRTQVDFAVSSLTKVSGGMKRLAENIASNHEGDLEDPEEREGIISGLSDIFFELFRQLRTDEIREDADAGQAFMVSEVTKLVKELKQWSEEEGELNPDAPAQPSITLTTPDQPRLSQRESSSDTPLPEGWRVNYDSTGRAYYYHRLTRKPQWHRPRPSFTPSSPPPSPPPPPPPPSATPYIEEFELDAIV